MSEICQEDEKVSFRPEDTPATPTTVEAIPEPEPEPTKPPEPEPIPDDEPPIIEVNAPEMEPIRLDKVSDNLDVASDRHDIQKMKYKRDIIESIKKIAPGRYSDRQLTRMKKHKLKELLTETFEDKCLESVGIEEIEVDDEKEKRIQQNGKLVVEAMYRVTLGLANLVEAGSKKFNGYIGGYCLHEYSKNIDENDFSRETLKQVLFEVYTENEQMLSSMMTKEGRLIAVFVMSAAASCRKFSPELINGRTTKASFQQNRMPRGKQEFRQNNRRDSIDLNAKLFRGPIRRDHSVLQRSKLSSVEIPRGPSFASQGLP